MHLFENLYLPIYGRDFKNDREGELGPIPKHIPAVFFRILSNENLKNNGVVLLEECKKKDCWYIQYFVNYPCQLILKQMQSSSHFNYVEVPTSTIALLTQHSSILEGISSNILRCTAFGREHSGYFKGYTLYLSRIFHSFFYLMYLSKVQISIELPIKKRLLEFCYLKKQMLFSYQELLFFELLLVNCRISTLDELYIMIDLFLSKFLKLLFYNSRSEVLSCFFDDFLPLMADTSIWGKSHLLPLKSSFDVEFFLQNATTHFGPDYFEAPELMPMLRDDFWRYDGPDFIFKENPIGDIVYDTPYVYNWPIVGFFDVFLIKQAQVSLHTKRFHNFTLIP